MAVTPADWYAEGLARREHERTRLHVVAERLGAVRLGLAALFIALMWAGGARYAPVWSALIPAACFVGVVLRHRQVRRAEARATRAAAWYRGGLDRVQGGASGSAPGGDRFNDEHHPYAADLDLFGAHGLFQRLCAARTPMGESVLARWLLTPADVATLRARQSAIEELRDRADFREAMALTGELPRITPDAASLESWSTAPSALDQPWLPVVAALLAAAAALTGLLWILAGVASPFLAVVALEALLTYVLRARLHAAVSGVEHAQPELALISALLQRIEVEQFVAPALQQLAASLPTTGRSASAALAQLATRVNFVEARRNPFLGPLLLPLLYTVNAALAAERWRRRHGGAVTTWLRVVGDMEALLSLAGYRFERPADIYPEFISGPATFVATSLGHPLIAESSCVRNDVALSEPTRVLLVSGSNMSGKSTLLRAVGVNTVLAMAGAPVCAGRLRLTPMRIGASIRLNDSLQGGSSRFYAEITRLKQLFEPAPMPLLFLLDELLQGTNSNDRRIGAHGVVRALIERGFIGLISTHDLALTEAGQFPPGALRNVHFEDALADGRLLFDFRLRDGVVTKSNGVELMRAIGLDV